MLPGWLFLILLFVTSVKVHVQIGVGINTSTPLSLLHVKEGNSGATPSSMSVATFESDGDFGINLLTRNAFETGIYFGNTTHPIHGAIVYNSSTTNGLAFRTNGNLDRMVITSGGNVGIGTILTSTKLDVNATSGDPFRAAVNGDTRLRVWNNGGTSIGNEILPPVNGLWVSGPIEPYGGIRSSDLPIYIESVEDSIEIKAGNNRIVVQANGAIKIVTTAGNDILIDAGTGSLTLKGSQVNIESLNDVSVNASANVQIDANEIELESNDNININSGVDLELSSLGLTTLLGGQVRLNGGTTPIAKNGSLATVSGSIATVNGNLSPTVFTQ